MALASSAADVNLVVNRSKKNEEPMEEENPDFPQGGKCTDLMKRAE